MTATDVSDTLDIALKTTGLNRVRMRDRPRLLSDNMLYEAALVLINRVQRFSPL